MKKIFSVIALAGALVACQPEKLETAFEVSNAVVTINVSTVDLTTGQPATGVVLTAEPGEIKDGKVVITGTPTVKEGDVKITATYRGKSYEQTVHVNGLLAGGEASYSIVMVVGAPVGDYEYRYSATNVEENVEVKYFEKAEHSHADKMWAKNISEFLLKGTVDYTVYSGSKTTSVSASDPDFKSIVDAYGNAFDMGIDETSEVLDITVSAYCWYTAWQTRTTTVTDYTVYAKKAGEEEFAIGTLVVESAFSTAAEYTEIADPEGHGHYHYGHGIHGNTDNAGGGIVFAE